MSILVIIARYFLSFLHKTSVEGTHKKCLGEALLMSTYNLSLYGEIS